MKKGGAMDKCRDCKNIYPAKSGPGNCAQSTGAANERGTSCS